MRTKDLTTTAAWLWLPLLVAAFIVLGFFRSATDPGSSDAGSTGCPAGSQLGQFLHC